MRQASLLLGIMTLIVSVGAFIAFERAEAPSAPLETVTTDNNPMTMHISSPDFEEGGKIPSRYTCDAENVSPEIRIEGAPAGTVSFVLVMDDPDIPESVKQARGIEKFNHWALYNIPGDTTVLETGTMLGTVGQNSRGESAYTGPCPPDREHRYFFRLYALSGTLNFIQAPTLDELETAAQGMMLESATLMGRYERTTVQ
jgi:Raf kinase inhibitor-like YbhB/YbcL family protein